MFTPPPPPYPFRISLICHRTGRVWSGLQPRWLSTFTECNDSKFSLLYCEKWKPISQLYDKLVVLSWVLLLRTLQPIVFRQQDVNKRVYKQKDLNVDCRTNRFERFKHFAGIAYNLSALVHVTRWGHISTSLQ